MSPDIQQNSCLSSRRKTLKDILLRLASWQCISSQFATFFSKDWIHRSPKIAASTL
jgi:hypothetical protein